VQFGVLGPVEMRQDGEIVPLGGPKQRALLAFLLLHANEAVSRDRLIEALWGERPPASVEQSLDSYISRLRRLVGPGRIERQAEGYRLQVERDELDLLCFEKLVEAGRLHEGLALWRGEALADILFEPFAAAESARLEDRRVDVLEERFAADLAAGAGAELVPELERLARAHPLRERLTGQLALALYRAGRQSGALEELRRMRRWLAEELGLDPGLELQELERHILAHDPTLDSERRRAPSPKRIRMSRGWALGALATVIVAGATTASIVATHGHATVARVVRLPAAPSAMAVAAGSLWAAVPGEQAVLRLDERSGAVIDRIPTAGQPGSLAVGAGGVWVASTLSGVVERIDPPTEQVSQRVVLGQEHTTALAYAHRTLWVADATDDAILEIDPASGETRRTIALDSRPTAIAVGAHALWVAEHDAGAVQEFNLQSHQPVATIPVGNGPSALTLGAGALWVANSLDSTVSRIDPSRAIVTATISVPSWPSALAVDGANVWVASQYAHSVSRIAPSRNVVVEDVRVGDEPDAVVAARGRVWIGRTATAAHRGGTLVLVSSASPSTVDPAMYAAAPASTFTDLAFDSLVRFALASGPDGLRLVPDLALQIPTASADGTAYRFRLRPGIRYSDGTLVRASDFRRGLERVFRLRSPGISDYTSLVGATACLRRPTSCDLTAGVATDDYDGTVTFHLTSPDPDFLFKLTDFGFAAPVPRTTPNRDMKYQAIPGTGPYRIERASPTEVRLVRNPYFQEWSHAAQPDGNPDMILWHFSGSHQRTLRWVEDGKADWSFDLVSPDELRAIRIQHPRQLRANPIYAAEFLPLNTRLPPFDDVRVRRALNLAIDRRTIARMYGGAFVAVPTCQPLLPGLVGYRRYCPYTRNPSPDGAYHGPDLAAARRLVAASGTRGERIDVWGLTDETIIPPGETAYVADVLRRLGYRVRTHLLPSAKVTSEMRRSHQISTDGDWLPAYPAPSSYMIPFFSCGGGLSNRYDCDPALDREMQHALALQLIDPKRAAALWATADRRATNLAYWVPTVTDGVVELVSNRVHNYEFQAAYGSFIADQAWLH
jgi:ABC-type transport system substrate-binding protein/DNA-binding SARP family transcriptional activator